MGLTATYRIQLVISLTASDAVSEYEEEEGDKDRVSRLFYLQLYSDTLDKEKHEEDKDYRKKIKKLYEFKRNSTRVRSHFIHKFFVEYYPLPTLINELCKYFYICNQNKDSNSNNKANTGDPPHSPNLSDTGKGNLVSRLLSSDFIKSFSWMNVNRLLRDPADNMARENTKNKAAGRRHEQQNNSIGGKENFHIMAVLPNNVYYRINV